MNFEKDQEIESFAHRFLIHYDAAVEMNDTCFEAILPEKLSQLLEAPEYIRINRGSQSGDEAADRGIYSINYGSPLLEKMIGAICSRAPFVACDIEFDYLKSQGFDKLIREQITFIKSIGKVESFAKVRTDYILLTVRYVAQSDEQKEGLLSLVFNLETGSHIPTMVRQLSLVPKEFILDNKNIHWEEAQIMRIIEGVRKQAKKMINQEIGHFQESMNRRYNRDIMSLEEYYGALKREMERSLQKSNFQEQSINERREKIALLPDELARKKDDLYKKYSIKVKIEPCTVMLIKTSAIKIFYRVSVGRDTTTLSLLYNPVTKSIDPLVCMGCKESITTVHFCDTLHLLCSSCYTKCPVCNK
ncbi:MAG: hypothetical protein ACMUIP_10235 [bacterium]